MPIYIIRVNPDGEKNEEIASLCDDCWRLPDQGDALEAWLAEHAAKLPVAEYRADIGFASREDACGGGAAFSPTALRQMADLGMTLWLSEYPIKEDFARNSCAK